MESLINPSGGGSVSGPPTLADVTTIAASGAAQELSFGEGNASYDIVLTDDCALSFIDAVADKENLMVLTLRQDATGNRVPSWPANVIFSNGQTPAYATLPNRFDVFQVRTIDGGVFYHVAPYLTDGRTPTVPGAPTGLTATAGDAQVMLSWTPPIGAYPAVTVYNVYGGTDQNNLAFLSSVAETDYTHLGLVNDTTYYYKVAAENPVGEGALSTQAQATPAVAGGSELTNIGSLGNFAASPVNAEANGITKVFEIIMGYALDSWDNNTLQVLAMRNTFQWYAYINADGQPGMSLRIGGSSVGGALATAVGGSPGELKFLRFRADSGEIAGNWTIGVDVGPDEDGPWTPIGADVSGAGGGPLAVDTGQIEIGSQGGGNSDFAPGSCFYFSLREDGVDLQKIDWRTKTPGTGPFTGETGDTWTLYGTAAVVES